MPRLKALRNLEAQDDFDSLVTLKLAVTNASYQLLKPLLEAEFAELHGKAAKNRVPRMHRNKRVRLWLESLSSANPVRAKYQTLLLVGYASQARDYLEDQYRRANPVRPPGRPAGYANAHKLRAVALGNVVAKLLRAAPRTLRTAPSAAAKSAPNKEPARHAPRY